MTDLDEREQQVHERATRAAAGLHRAAALRSLAGIAPAPNTPSTRWRLVVVACAVLVGISGLFVVRGRHTEPIARTETGEKYWTIAGLPAGWMVSEVIGPDFVAPLNADTTPVMALFATAAAPKGPVVAIYRYPLNFQSSPGSSFASNFVESITAGRRLVLADNSAGGRTGWVEVDGQWLVIAARSVSDDILTAIAGAVAIDNAGHPAVSPDQLPSGLVEMGTGNARDVAPAMQSGLFGSALRVITITETSPDGRSSASLITAPASRSELAMLALGSEVSETTVGGARGWIGGPVSTVGSRVVVWERDGTVFVLRADEAATGDLVALAASVRPARRGEVPSLGNTPTSIVTPDSVPFGTNPPDTTASGRPVPSAVVSTVPPTTTASSRPVPSAVVSVVPPVVIDVTRTERSTSEIELGATLPEGNTFAVDVAVIADYARYTVKETSPSIVATGFSTVKLPTRSEGQQQLLPLNTTATSPELRGMLAVTQNPDAKFLQVLRADGSRYRAKLMSTTAHPDVLIAALLVRADEFVSASLIDGADTVLATQSFGS